MPCLHKRSLVQFVCGKKLTKRNLKTTSTIVRYLTRKQKEMHLSNVLSHSLRVLMRLDGASLVARSAHCIIHLSSSCARANRITPCSLHARYYKYKTTFEKSPKAVPASVFGEDGMRYSREGLYYDFDFSIAVMERTLLTLFRFARRNLSSRLTGP